VKRGQEVLDDQRRAKRRWKYKTREEGGWRYRLRPKLVLHVVDETRETAFQKCDGVGRENVGFS
jgi:hypothetical protein